MAPTSLSVANTVAVVNKGSRLAILSQSERARGRGIMSTYSHITAAENCDDGGTAIGYAFIRGWR